MNKNQIKKNRGMGMIEILIGSTIIVVGVLALINAYTTYIKYALSNEGNVQANYLIEEGIEAMNFLRDKGWTTYIAPLSTVTTYYLTWNGSYWASTTTPQYIDSPAFLRKVNLASVYRNASDQIATSGTLDSNTKKVTVTVDYFQGHATTTRSISSYISNVYGN